MKYVLDTCVISEFTKQSPNPKVVAWLRSCDQSALFLSCITIGELAKGIAKLPDGKKKENLAHWLREDLQIRFHERIIALDLEVMLGWGNLCGLLENTGTSVPVMDSLIAACAIAYDMTLVTHNPGDFTAMQVKIINPWD